MWRKIEYPIWILIALVFFLIFRYWMALIHIRKDHLRIESLLRTSDIVIDEHKVDVPSEGKVTIKPKGGKKLEDVVDIKIQKFGLTFRPGLQIGIPYSTGLDGKIVFWNRLGLNLGFLYSIVYNTYIIKNY